MMTVLQCSDLLQLMYVLWVNHDRFYTKLQAHTNGKIIVSVVREVVTLKKTDESDQQLILILLDFTGSYD